MKNCLTGLSLMLLVMTGCGGGTTDRGPAGTLSGKVTFKGAAVDEGVVVLFSDTANGGAQGAIQSGGSYNVTTETGGVPPGEYGVAVLPPTVVIPDTADSPGGEGLKEVDNIPEKYRSPGTSGLTVTIKEGSNTFDVEMTE